MTEHVHDGGEAQVLDAALTPVGQRETQVLRGHKDRREGVRRLRGQRPLPGKLPCRLRPDPTHLSSPLVVEGEDVVPAAGLALPHQEDSMSFGPRALHQVCCLHPGDGPVEPWVGEEEVVAFLEDLFRQGESDRVWRDKQNPL